ncbi:LysR family transcriptional regulator [Marinobacterium aestuariivivens]|uniref:LysR family transcriptional regulator n=1 Tax=Marinobacterium aestuariivivens TaxID=1698799 RepID=A0ABW1ZYK5_9GAMM
MSSSFGFDLRTLEVFVQIAKTGNLTAAARRLGMSQSSLSQILTNLEAEMRVELMDRSVRPMEVTTAGRYLLDRAQSLLHEARLTSLKMRKADYKLLRHVKIALVDSIITAVGKPLIDVLRQRTQDWSAITGQSHLHAHLLLSRQADIVISDDPLAEHSDLDRHRILREPFVLAVPNDYRGPKSLDEILERLDFIRYSTGSLIGQDIERFLRRVPLEPPLRLQLDNSFAVVSAVASSIGCTITTPLCLFQSGIRQHQVTLLPLGHAFFREITLTTRKGELGDLPGMIARDCRRILQESFLAEIGAEYDWLLPQIEV